MRPPGLSLNTRFTRGDCLHQAVAAHRFVDVHGVQTWGVETGEPHIAHQDNLEWIFGIAETQRQFLPSGLVADMLLPVGRIGG